MIIQDSVALRAVCHCSFFVGSRSRRDEKSVILIFSSNVPAAEEQGYQDFIKYFCCWKRR